MADSEEFRLKRLKHDEHLSRVFDEVMGLGDFAESSRGSAASSRSGGLEETKGVEETSGQGEPQQLEEDSNSSRQEGKMDESVGESSFTQLASPSSDRQSSFTIGTGGGGGGGSGGAAFDDALDGLPAYAPEEDDEDWHFALPMGTLEDVEVDKANRKKKMEAENAEPQKGDPFAREPRQDEEQDKEASRASANTSHSSQDHTSDSSRDGGGLNQTEETEDSQQGERPEAAPVEDSNPSIPPCINIKDEPIDEGYDAALLPQSSIRHIKQELEHQEVTGVSGENQQGHGENRHGLGENMLAPQRKEELRISSVYSVGGPSTFVSSTVPAAVPAPPPAAIFIPGRGAVLQAMAPLPIRQPTLISSTLPALTPMPPRPPQPPIPGSVRCSGCSKVLLKGQTAFQRKGSTQLFCSTVCLSGHLPPAPKPRSCCQCNREILQPKDMITIPGDDGVFVNFCSQFCLSVFRHKKKTSDKQPDRWPEKRPENKFEKQPEKRVDTQLEQPFCSVCRVRNRHIEHEVTHQGRLHRLCSDACFVTWRKIRQLAMNCCEGCGLYCNSNSGSCQTLTIDRSQLNFCSPTCIATFKQTCRKMTECANCHQMITVSFTIMERDHKGKVQLYCSPSCVEQCRPPRHMLSGTPFPCSLCKTTAVPQYHLAMVDGTIRNFCSYDCVSVYRKTSHAAQPDLINGVSSPREPSVRDTSKPGPSSGTSSVPPIPQEIPSSVPYPGHHPSHTSVPPLAPPYPALSSPSVPVQALTKAPFGQFPKPAEGGATESSRLTCHQCSKQFSLKPVLFSHQGCMSVFCSKLCCDQYKIQKNILAHCEYCKQEKVVFDVLNYNQQELFFCSENCKILFKHDLTTRNKDHPWRPCSYCSSISQKMLHSHYGGQMEEFCRPHCMSQYTVLYYGMGRCDTCRKQGYMTEKLQCLGSVRNFCSLPCLLQYCCLHFETSQHINSNGTGSCPAPVTPYAPTQPHHSSKMNPVIADVVSLASGSATQPSVLADTALTGAVPTSSTDGKNLDHASTQTDALRVPVSHRRQMKNKSVLCRPFTMDQESMCLMSTSAADSEALLDSPSVPDQPPAEASTTPVPSPKHQPFNGLPARLTGRHFLGRRDTNSDCKVCSQSKRKLMEEEVRERKRSKMEEDEEPDKIMKEEANKDANPFHEKDVEIKEAEQSVMNDGAAGGRTSYYCKTCLSEPSLCPVPCFELFHTRLIYKTANQQEAQVTSSPGEEKVKVLMVPVPVPVFIPVPMNMYSQKTPVPVAMPMPVPVPLVVPPQKKEVSDAAVQSEPLHVEEDKQKIVPVAIEDQVTSHTGDIDPEEVTPILNEDDDTQTQECTMQTDEREDPIEQTDEKEDSIGQTDEKEDSIGQTDEIEESIEQTDEKEDSIEQTDEKEESIEQAVEKEECTVKIDERGGCTIQIDEKEECTVKTDEKEECTVKTDEKEECTVKTDEKEERTVKTDEKEERTVKTDEKEEHTVKTDEKEECAVQTDEKEECAIQTDEKEACTVQADEKEACTVQTAKKEACTVQTAKKEACTVQTAKKEACTVQTAKKEACTVQTDKKAGRKADPQLTVCLVRSAVPTDPKIRAQPEESMITSDPPSSSTEHQPPSSPVMDLETDLPTVLLDKKRTTPKRGVKRPRDGSCGRKKRSRRRTASLDRSAVNSPATSKLNHLYGVKAWKNWVQQCNSQPQGSHSLDIKEDILQCDSAQLSLALSRFVKQVRRPNGETYSPDSIFYLCLGIQQYLFIKGRIENIFTDELYSQFAKEITGMLRLWKPKLLSAGGIVSSRVEESYLWECKQLGAYSPIVLLNTLLFFCTKSFGFTTLAQHKKLSFLNFSRHSKPCSRTGKVHSLRYLRSTAGPTTREETERSKKKQDETGGEMLQNTANPLHCPVRLYEFYLSRCPESAKKRSDAFYLQPEKNVNTHSSHWFTSQPLESSTLQSMLTRILAVREVQQKQEAALQQPAATSSAAGDGIH